MKKPGPKARDAEVIALHGNPGHLSKEQIAARKASTPKPRSTTTAPPAGLSPAAAEVWKRHAAELDTLGLLSVLDREALRLACETFAVGTAALESMRPKKADGSPDRRFKSFEVIIPDPNHGGLRRHPGVMVFFQSSAEYRRWCTEFGLTPASRVGLRPGFSAGGLEDLEDDDGAFFGTSAGG